MLISVDTTLDTPPYVQIEEQLRGYIERGDLAPQALLPTVRQLAGDLGVAPNTVARAYADLQEQGWLVSEGRRGTRVAPKTPAAHTSGRSGALRDAFARFVETLQHRGFTRDEIAREARRLLSS